ncbi:DUF58 domain-containing protein [Anaeromicropila herbilytica]|uniref:DUF58 domain-containing protein n=1 Tax=Anaeromicropila herbilytica TaxID=2785025 RepID=A0A7R7EIP3_9FIRM|nr:DUF58 domain-containing protein [Anaeromicropila herbilytica]BCN29414.1 hypothetical protein bsdtb5_07090 [Anaeromicropila herbilytica]
MLINRIILASLIVVAGIFASFYGGNIPYAFFYMTLIVPVLSFFYTFYVYIRLKMYQNIGKRTVVKGEVTDFNFQIANEDVIPYQNIKVGFYHDMSRILDSKEEKEYSLLLGEMNSLDTSICCNYMGEYYIGAKTVTITDFLYLFSITYTVLSKMKVWVLPRVVLLTNVKIISINPDSKKNVNRIGNEEADIEVRKYISGDNKKHIHWKLSAKKRELYTRKYTSIPKMGITIFMDLSRVEEDELTNFIVKDKIMESTLAIANYCKDKGIPSMVQYEQTSIQCIPIITQQDFDSFYHNSIALRFHTNRSIDHIMSSALEQDIATKQIHQYIAITHYLSEGLYKECLNVINNGFECGIILINDMMDQESNYLVKLIMQAGVNMTIVNYNDEIAEVL